MTTRIVIADDHGIVREGLRLVLEAEPDLCVVGEASTGSEAVREVCRLTPDVVLMDLAMPEVGGLEATRRIAADALAVRVVVLSMHATSQHVSEAFRAGAHGYLVKESAASEVVEAVRAVAAGRRYLCRRLRDLGTISPGIPAGGPSPLARLSGRELEVLTLVVEGCTSAEIAARLHLSPRTVETYRSRLMAKLGVADATRLVKLALRLGVTTLG